MKKILFGLLTLITLTASTCSNDDDGPSTPKHILDGHEYVQIGRLKWATMNIGATTVAGSPATCFGDYFAWGEVEPRYTGKEVVSAEKIDFTGWKEGHPKGYSTEDMPTYNRTSLDAAHDPATKAWGSKWRTPSVADFYQLFYACGGTGEDMVKELPIGTPSTTEKGIYLCNNYYGVKGYLFCDGINKVFFPATGCIHGTNYNYFFGYETSCWTSDIVEKWTTSAHRFTVTNGGAFPADQLGRQVGFTVRPVSN